MGGGKERKMNGQLATADLVKGRWKSLKKSFSKQRALKKFVIKKALCPM
jgi:hypothetical protein